VDLKYAKNALEAPSPILILLGAFGASILAPSALSFCAPNVKLWLRPWVKGMLKHGLSKN